MTKKQLEEMLHLTNVELKEWQTFRQTLLKKLKRKKDDKKNTQSIKN